MKRLIFALAFAVSLYAQSPACDDNARACRHLFFYDGSSNLQYECKAAQTSITSTFKKVIPTLTNIIVATNVATATTPSAHGFNIGDRFTVSGATVDTDLNGTYTVASAPSSTTFTFATAAVADATYTESTLVISTNAPLTVQPVWAIRVFEYTGTTLNGFHWADARSAQSLKCSDRALY